MSKLFGDNLVQYIGTHCTYDHRTNPKDDSICVINLMSKKYILLVNKDTYDP